MTDWEAEVEVKRGDYGYALWFRLREEVTDELGQKALEPVDLSSAEEINLICKIGGSPAFVLGPLDAECEAGDDAADWENGIIGYIVEEPDFESVAELDAEIEVRPSGGGRITWPRQGFVTIIIGPDLGDAE